VQGHTRWRGVWRQRRLGPPAYLEVILDIAMIEPWIAVAAGAEPEPPGGLGDLPPVLAGEGVAVGEDAV
jgi:hypothetical protein